MNTFYIVGSIALLALVPAPALQAVLASTASTLFESTPFILAGVLLAELMPRRASALVRLMGCGCSGGPGALSLPVAAATWLTFGPLVAAARWVAALAVSSFQRKQPSCSHPAAAGGELFTLLPFALGAAAAFVLLPWALFAHHPFEGTVAAAAVAAVASPCGFGAIALAATAHHLAPRVTVAVLCIAGICDLRSLGIFRHMSAGHDACAYLLAAFACALVAAHHGNALVNPRFTFALWCAAAIFLQLAWRYRGASAPCVRIAPALMLAAGIISAPPPAYLATETTLSESYAGEAIVFRGALAREGTSDSLVRFAVTCCRADAQPVAVQLARPLPEAAGQWIVAHGRLALSNNRIVLNVANYERIPAPADPFLYR